MKRLIPLIILSLLAALLSGCGTAAPAGSVPKTEVPASFGVSAAAQPPAADSEAPAAQEPAPDQAPEPEQEEVSVQESETRAEESVRSTPALVVVFSCTGTTRGIGERIAALTGADIAEIVPAQPYTEEDLDYDDRSTRASAEQDDPDVRPEIAEDISLDGYTTVYLGYPIWWGQAPRILNTFVEGHDFTGITVIPFCTSGSSDIGESDDTLAGQAGSGDWLQGKRFSGDVSDEDLQAWVDETGGPAVKQAPEQTLHLAIDGTEVAVEWEDNESAHALNDLVSSEPLTVQLSMYGGFEQVGSLGTDLPRDDVQTTTDSGDIVLYSGDQIVIFYGSNSWDYTRLGRITDRSEAEMAELLGNGDVTITLSWE